MARARDLALPALACALYVGVRLWRLDAACLWFDEIFGVHAAAWHGWGAMWRFVALDLIHPPLFYALLKAWAGAVGAGSVWWLRLLPVVVSVLTLLPMALLARELRLAASTLNLALVLAAVSGTLIKYAQELRMYSLLLLFAAGSLWLFARCCNSATEARRGDALALFVANLLLVYTHYFGWLVVALEVIYVAIFARAKLKAFAASFAGLAACFAPWGYLVWRAAGAGGGFEQNLGWAARPRWRELFEPYLALHEPFRARQQSNEPAVLGISVALAILIFAPPLAALGWRVFARRANRDDARGARRVSMSDVNVENVERGAVAFLIFFAFAPALFAFALAQVLPQSVWGARHLIVVAPAYLLLSAHALETLRPRWLSVTLKLLLGCWLALAGVVAVARRPPAPVWCAWEPLAIQVARDEKSGAAVTTNDPARAPDSMSDVGAAIKIYAFEDLIAYQLWYALRASGGEGLRVAVVRGVPGVLEDRAFFLPRGFNEVSIETIDAAMREERFWIALRGAGRDEESPVLNILRARGYVTKRRFEFAADGQKAFMILARRR